MQISFEENNVPLLRMCDDINLSLVVREISVQSTLSKLDAMRNYRVLIICKRAAIVFLFFYF